MTIDELMTVWKTQESAPLHDMNRTLLHLALRQEEAKLEKKQRWARWMVYVCCAGAAVGMALFLVNMILLMIDRYDRSGLAVWDIAVPIVGATAAVISARAIYVNHRAQSLREQGFGESLRDQLHRSIARLDHEQTGARRTGVLVVVLAGGICPAAIVLLGWRVNGKSISDDGYLLVTLIIGCVLAAVGGVWQLRRSVQREILPRKRRLEALLTQLDGQ